MSALKFLETAVIGGFYLFLPAYFANMVPVGASSLFRRMGWWNKPIWEAGLGANKTWVGTVAGFVAAILVAWGEANIDSVLPFFTSLRPNIIRNGSPIMIGALFALGALIVGDMGKSLLKRQAGVKPGAPWKPWDDIDHGIGVGIILMPFMFEIPLTILAGVAIGYVFNPIVNLVSYKLGLKTTPD